MPSFVFLISVFHIPIIVSFIIQASITVLPVFTIHQVHSFTNYFQLSSSFFSFSFSREFVGFVMEGLQPFELRIKVITLFTTLPLLKLLGLKGSFERAVAFLLEL